MCRLICTFVIRIWHKQVFSRWGSNYSGSLSLSYGIQWYCHEIPTWMKRNPLAAVICRCRISCVVNICFCVCHVLENVCFNLYRGIVNFLNTRTLKKIVVITLKFELCGSTIEYWVQTVQTEWQTVQTQIRLPSRSSLIWVCTVCPGISVRKLRIITVI